MKARLISAGVMIAVVLPLLIFGGVFSKVLALFVSLTATYEFLSAFKKAGKNPMIIPSVILLLPSVLSFFTEYTKTFEIRIPATSEINLFPIIVLSAMVSCMIILVFGQGKFKPEDAFISFFGGFYITVMVNFFTLLRNCENGLFLVIFALLGSVMADTFALFTGKLFGKHKLCPKISPKKTVEGSIGAFGGALVFCVLYIVVLNLIGIDIGISYAGAVVLALLNGFLSQIGDLFASCVKRYCGIKDFGNLIPGHGGVLDRIDSYGVCLLTTFLYVELFII